MVIIFAVAGSNRTVTCFNVKMFPFLTQIFPRDFINFFIRNYFCFLLVVFHKWLADFKVKPFYKLNNDLDLDLRFILCKYVQKVSLHSI